MRLTLANCSSCTGCLACIDSCPFNALVAVENSEGFIAPQRIEASCNYCHKCETICPVLATKRKTFAKGTLSSYPMAAWSLDKETRLKSASGGVFVQLARAFVEAGGYVAGAVMDGVSVKHEITNSLSNLHLFQGSKYLQSDTAGIYAQTKSLLSDSKPVLFSGTPCQIAGLRHFLGLAENIDKLLTVEVVCHGVPSGKVMERFLETEKDITEIVSFRDKRHGWKNSFGMVVKKHDIETHIPYNKNYFTRTFAADNALRLSCYACPFASDGSQADISLADFWRLKRWPEEHDAGVSAVIVRSSLGERIINSCSRLNKVVVPWDEVADGNPRLCSGKHIWLMRWHPLRIFLDRNLRSMSSEQFLFLYSGVAKLTLTTFWYKLSNRIWAPLLRWHRKILLKRFLILRKRQRKVNL